MIRSYIASSPVVGADETSAKVNGEKHWIWTFQNSKASYLACEQKRNFKVITKHFPQEFTKSIYISDRYKAHLRVKAKAHQLANFMNDAQLMTTLDYSCNCPGTPGYIIPGTPCDDGNPYTINDIEDGFCNCKGTTIPVCGQINNSEFTQVLTGWRWWNTDASIMNDEVFFTDFEFAEQGFGYDGINVIQGESYNIKFDAYASQNRPISITLYEPQDEFGNDGVVIHNSTVNITSTKTEYEVTFTAAASVNEAFLELNFSGNAADVFLDNICFDTECVSPNCNTACDENTFSIQTKALWEGYFDGTTHTLDLNENGLLPVQQPFGSSVTNTTASYNTPQAVDWVGVCIHNTVNAPAIECIAALIYPDGTIHNTTGDDCLTFQNGMTNGAYHISVHHEGHLSLYSSQTVTTGDFYDFSSSLSMADGIQQMKNINGNWLAFGGDYDKNGIINNEDFNIWSNQGAAVNVYTPADADGNGVINNMDYNIWTLNRSKIGRAFGL